MFNKKKYHTRTLVGVKNELSILLLHGDKHLAMLTAANGEVRVNYDFDPPILAGFFGKAYWKKYQEAWEYIYNVADIQANNG